MFGRDRDFEIFDLDEGRNRKRRKKMPFDWRYLLIAAAAAAVILIAVFAFGKKEAGSGGADGTEKGAETATPSDSQAAEEESERQAALDAYENLGLVNVEGYLNLRESPSTDADVIGKMRNGSACEILDDDAEGWYHVSSGGLEGYISSEFVLTGQEAREEARHLVKLYAIIKADKLNIREKPDTSSAAVGYVLQNERYPVVSETDGWVEIAGGFISAEYAEVRYALDEAQKLDLKSMVFNLYDNLGISNVDTYLNIREAPDVSAKVIGKMPSKSAGDILETLDGWYKIKSGPITGYVSSEFILTGPAAKDEALKVAELMAIVSTDRLNARSEPSTESAIWTQISNNERYAVLNQMDGWVEIELDTSTAFVSTDFVDVRYALPEAVEFSELDGNQSLRNRMVNYALQFLGNRYVWGGNDPHTGADCSGFVKYICSNVAGVSLPRVSREQAKTGTRIDSSQMRPGDLVFYTGRNGVVNHVAMYIGNGQIVHAASRRSGIKISTWNYRNPYRIVNVLGD